MRIHREGYRILIFLLLVLAAANILVYTFAPSGPLLFLLFSITIYLLAVWFFRAPSRATPLGENLVVSPADGKVVVIEETDENEYFNDRRLQVSIFMSPLNVHVNLFPIAGSVTYYKYHPGDYMVAWHPKASARNERSSVVIQGNANNAILVRQIAGVLARRIVCYANTGDHVQQGQELGFIKFGSRVDLFLPVGIKLKVKVGQKVSGTTTVIASFE